MARATSTSGDVPEAVAQVGDQEERPAPRRARRGRRSRPRWPGTRPCPCGPGRGRSGSRWRWRSAIAARLTTGGSWRSPAAPRAADLHAAAHRLALLEDELDRVAEVAEQGDRACSRWPPPCCQGVVSALDGQDDHVEHRGQQHAQAAGHDHVGLEVGLLIELCAQAAGAREEGQRGQPDRGGRGDAQAGQDLGRGQRAARPGTAAGSRSGPCPRAASLASAGTPAGRWSRCGR